MGRTEQGRGATTGLMPPHVLAERSAEISALSRPHSPASLATAFAEGTENSEGAERRERSTAPSQSSATSANALVGDMDGEELCTSEKLSIGTSVIPRLASLARNDRRALRSLGMTVGRFVRSESRVEACAPLD